MSDNFDNIVHLPGNLPEPHHDGHTFEGLLHELSWCLTAYFTALDHGDNPKAEGVDLIEAIERCRTRVKFDVGEVLFELGDASILADVAHEAWTLERTHPDAEPLTSEVRELLETLGEA